MGGIYTCHRECAIAPTTFRVLSMFEYDSLNQYQTFGLLGTKIMVTKVWPSSQVLICVWRQVAQLSTTWKPQESCPGEKALVSSTFHFALDLEAQVVYLNLCLQ